MDTSSVDYVNTFVNLTGIRVGYDPSHLGDCDPETAEAVGRIPLGEVFDFGSLTGGLFTSMPPHGAKLHYLARLAAWVYSGSPNPPVPFVSDVQLMSAAVPPGIRSMNIAGERIVVVPGTTTQLQIKAQTAGYLLPAPWPPGGVVNDLHNALALLMAPLLPADTRLVVGHSMGGVLALHLAFLGRAAGLPIVGAVGFGSPRGWSDTAVAATTWPNWINVSNVFDSVPLLPPDGTGGFAWRMPEAQWQLDGIGQFRLIPTGVSTPDEIAVLLAAVGDSFHWTTRYVDFTKASFQPLREDAYAEHADEIQIRQALQVDGGVPIYSAPFDNLRSGQRLPVVGRMRLGQTNWIVCGDSNMFGGFDCPGQAEANRAWVLNLCSVYE